MEQQFCKKCNFPILVNYYFCPNCGRKIKEPPLATGIGKQIIIYTTSILFPPFGLWPGIKYLLAKNSKAKIIGLITIILTIVSSVISIMLIINLLNSSLNQLNQINQLNQLNQVAPGTNEQILQLQELQKQGL